MGFFATCLHFYAAMAMGHMFNKDKILLSIVFFVAISFALSMMTSLLAFRIDSLELYVAEFDSAQVLGFMNRLLRFSLAVELIQGALLYFATTLSLRRGLNLA